MCWCLQQPIKFGSQQVVMCCTCKHQWNAMVLPPCRYRNDEQLQHPAVSKKQTDHWMSESNYRVSQVTAHQLPNGNKGLWTSGQTEKVFLIRNHVKLEVEDLEGGFYLQPAVQATRSLYTICICLPNCVQRKKTQVFYVGCIFPSATWCTLVSQRKAVFITVLPPVTPAGK